MVLTQVDFMIAHLIAQLTVSTLTTAAYLRTKDYHSPARHTRKVGADNGGDLSEPLISVDAAPTEGREDDEAIEGITSGKPDPVGMGKNVGSVDRHSKELKPDCGGTLTVIVKSSTGHQGIPGKCDCEHESCSDDKSSKAANDLAYAELSLVVPLSALSVGRPATTTSAGAACTSTCAVGDCVAAGSCALRLRLPHAALERLLLEALATQSERQRPQQEVKRCISSPPVLTVAPSDDMATAGERANDRYG